jgi:hypothetical protein
MRLRVLALAAGLLTWTSSGFSQGFIDGNHLYDVCNSKDDASKVGYCIGFTVGVTDTLGGEGKICVPERPTEGQAVDVVMNYLRANPEKRRLSAWSLARAALQQAFPCRPNSPRRRNLTVPRRPA